MARLNRNNAPLTHEGAPAFSNISPDQQLRRTVLSCLLWEDTFYESGQDIATRISTLAALNPPEIVAELAIEARSTYKLRHAPLWLLLDLIRRSAKGTAGVIASVIQRPDEMGELISMYWKDGKRPLSNQMRKGLAKAFASFDEYQLAKYNRDVPVKIRDVMFLVHPKPNSPEFERLYERVANKRLAIPDTWEVALSGGADKKETFTRMLQEGTLGYLALLRNLRNMVQAGVDDQLVRDAILARRGANRVLPFRYVAASRAAPRFEPQLDQALQESLKDMESLDGTTIVLVDVSGSMESRLSSHSDMSRMDAAAALAALIQSDNKYMFSFSRNAVEVPTRPGMAGIDAIIRSQVHGTTNIGAAIAQVSSIKHNRIIVITDEQAHDHVGTPSCENAYMVNVGSYENGVGYGAWTHIDGFSEGTIRYIYEIEANQLKAPVRKFSETFRAASLYADGFVRLRRRQK